MSPLPLAAPLALAWYALVVATIILPAASGVVRAGQVFAAGPWRFSTATVFANAGEIAATAGLACAHLLALWLAGDALLAWLRTRTTAAVRDAASYLAGCGGAAALIGGLLLVRLWYVPLLAAAVAGPAMLAAPRGLPRLRGALRALPRPGPWGALAHLKRKGAGVPRPRPFRAGLSS